MISSRSFGSRNKVPQEAVPREVEELVEELIETLELVAEDDLENAALVAQADSKPVHAALSLTPNPFMLL